MKVKQCLQTVFLFISLHFVLLYHQEGSGDISRRSMECDAVSPIESIALSGPQKSPQILMMKQMSMMA
jgi:hypothetical protein